MDARKAGPRGRVRSSGPVLVEKGRDSTGLAREGDGPARRYHFMSMRSARPLRRAPVPNQVDSTARL